jgi:hypothetical protein
MYTRPTGLHSLAEIRAQQTARVHTILFSTLKNECNDIGLYEGDVIRCRAASPTTLVLENRAGRTLILDQDWARFIAVTFLSETAPGRRRVPRSAPAAAGAL